MSHFKERKDKNCLNCNAQVYGRYCQICGQENIEPKETLWHLITHFVYDITHFDGKFFSTLKYLLFRPGYLSYEYIKGRRTSYLHPIRMYVFTSALFFIIFFYITKHATSDMPLGMLKEKYTTEKDSLQKIYRVEPDSLKREKLKRQIKGIDNELASLNSSGIIRFDDGPIDTTGTAKGEAKKQRSNGRLNFFGDNDHYKTLKQYNAFQDSLPGNKKDGWFKKWLTKRNLALNEKYEDKEEEFKENFTEKFLHSLPYMMFISLPLVSLILYLLYFRRRNTFYYVSHGIFIIHVYIAFYILTLISLFFDWLHGISHYYIFSWLNSFTIFLIFFYLYKAMRNFYQQKRFKTLLKYFIFSILLVIVFSLLAFVFVINSLLAI